ncbi:MAG: hypothetical protein KAY24_02405, partial [Candidatus Eisenbacteria sp.]|nr:hypothetical protein [Candidatus Eisenbacteria bacterium]
MSHGRDGRKEAVAHATCHLHPPEAHIVTRTDTYAYVQKASHIPLITEPLDLALITPLWHS